jgi:hypothetical protein
MIKALDTEQFSVDLLEMPPVGPGFHHIPKTAARLEIWESSGDAGPFCREFRLVDGDGRILCTRTMYPKIFLLEKERDDGEEESAKTIRTATG